MASKGCCAGGVMDRCGVIDGPGLCKDGLVITGAGCIAREGRAVAGAGLGLGLGLEEEEVRWVLVVKGGVRDRCLEH
eukprot:4886144-Ditylum_brightwellii.AAC.1